MSSLHRAGAICLMLPLTLTLPGTTGRAYAQDPVISMDSSFSVVLPGSFRPVLLNEAADLQFADTIVEAYVLAINESKEDLVGWNLTRHSTITLAQIVAGTDNPELSPRRELEVGGMPAVQYELRGAVQGMRIAYLHTTIELSHSFVQLLLWTRQSLWDQVQPAFGEALESFTAFDSGSRPPSGIFDIVPGTWAWQGREAECASVTQTFTITDDRRGMMITHSAPFERPDGTFGSVTEYVIEGSGPRILNTYIPSETRLTAEGDPVKWDLVVVARNRLAWHRADWVDGSLTGALVRCSTPAR